MVKQWLPSADRLFRRRCADFDFLEYLDERSEKE